VTNSDRNTHGEIRKAPASRANNAKGAWGIDKGELRWDDAETQFLRSRKLGIYGATRAVKPRTIVEYRWDLKQFFDFVRSREITHYGQLTESLILDYVEHLQSNGWSKATQRKYLISLKAFLKWVERDPACRGLTSFVRVLPRIGKEIRRTFIPSVEQMEMFRQGFDRLVIWGLRDYTAVCVMLDTGARIGEVCNLEPDDFKWDVGLVNLDGKTGERLVPFDLETTGQLIREWMRARLQFAHEDCKKVFISRFGGECSPDTFRQSFEDNLKRTGLDKNTWREHDFGSHRAAFLLHDVPCQRRHASRSATDNWSPKLGDAHDLCPSGEPNQHDYEGACRSLPTQTHDEPSR